jgi:phage internal scaffolding protein
MAKDIKKKGVEIKKYVRANGRIGYKKIYHDPTMAKQSFKESCDVNHILKKYQKTGVLPIMKNQKLYEDFADAPTYHESMNIIAKSTEQFEGLDADLRDRFNNDPYKFLEFVNNEDNSDEMIKLGLKEKPIVDDNTPIKVEVIPKESETPTTPAE